MTRARVATGLHFAYAATMTVDEIPKHLENADGQLAGPLAAGVEQAEALAPAVLEVITKANNGVYLRLTRTLIRLLVRNCCPISEDYRTLSDLTPFDARCVLAYCVARFLPADHRRDACG